MSIQSNINQGLFLGTAALGAIDKMAKEDTALAKQSYDVERSHALAQEEALDKLGPIPEEALTEEEKFDGQMKEMQQLRSNSINDPGNEAYMQHKFKGILGEKKKQDIYQKAAQNEVSNAQVFASQIMSQIKAEESKGGKE